MRKDKMKIQLSMRHPPQPCPACGAIIRPSDIRRKLTRATFDCPWCGEELKIDTKYAHLIWTICFLAGPTISWLWGYEGSMFVIVAASVTLVLLLLGILVVGVVIVPGYKRAQYSKERPFDRVVSLRLAKKHDTREKIDP
jgi:predicted RNA-binding Zn-ribbon protein involved in translation (DUF1610 family)